MVSVPERISTSGGCTDKQKNGQELRRKKVNEMDF